LPNFELFFTGVSTGVDLTGGTDTGVMDNTLSVHQILTLTLLLYIAYIDILYFLALECL